MEITKELLDTQLANLKQQKQQAAGSAEQALKSVMQADGAIAALEYVLAELAKEENVPEAEPATEQE